MNIKIVSFENTTTFSGGVEKHSERMVEALNDLDVQATLITRDPYDSILPDHQVRTVKVPYLNSLKSYHNARLTRKLWDNKVRHLIDDDDLVHAMDLQYHKPDVITYHSKIVDGEMAETGVRRIIQKFFQFFERQRLKNTYRNASRTIAVSNNVEKFFNKTYGFPIDAVICNAVEPPNTTYDGMISPFDKNIFAISRLTKVKRIDRIIKALMFLPEEYGLIVAGKGPDRDRLISLAEDLDVSDRTIFAGYVKDHEKWSLYRFSDVHVLPSSSEGQGITLLEALSVGCKIVVTKNYWLPDFLQHQVHVPDHVEHPGSWADKIREVVDHADDPDGGVPMWTDIAKQTLEIYEEIA